MEQNQNQIFRQQSLENMESPENSNSYIRVLNPGITIVLVAILIAVIGIFVWIFLGNVDSKVEVYFDSQGGKAEFFIPEDQMTKVARGTEVVIEGIEGKVMRVSDKSYPAGQFLDDYVLHLNGMNADTWSCQIRTNITVEAGIHKAAIMKERISPIRLIIGE